MKRWQIAFIAVLLITGIFFVDGGSIYVKQLLNRAPKAAFTYRTPTRTLKYIAPTDRDLILFLNNSTDPDGDLLTSQWFVRYNATGDWKLLNNSRDHWGRLPVSNDKGHEIRLNVSDGMKEDSTITVLPVDPSRLPQYPAVRLGIPIKGVIYHIGRYFSGEFGIPPTEDEMRESLTVIRDELDCNAIKLVGDFEDVMGECAETAIRKGFSEIILCPRYARKAPNIDVTIDEHVGKIISFSKKAEELRTKSKSIVLSIGDELTISVRGIANASNYEERNKEMNSLGWGDDYPSNLASTLNSYLKKILDSVRLNFGGRVTYTSGMGERYAVKWGELRLDIIAPHLYTWDWLQPSPGEWVRRTVDRIRIPGKPVYVSEFGCMTYKGAANGEDYSGQAYSQEEQARNIVDSVSGMEKAGINGVFLEAFLRKYVNDAESYGILKYDRNAPQRRKLGFYAYQSFVVAA